MKSKNQLEKLDLDLIQELNAIDSEMISGGAIDFRELTINFDSTKGKAQRESGTVTFGSRVLKAQAFLKGFHIGFDSKDHHFESQQIDLDITRINNNRVDVAADFLLRDKNGDDPYSGWINAVVIADVA